MKHIDEKSQYFPLILIFILIEQIHCFSLTIFKNIMLLLYYKYLLILLNVNTIKINR